MLGPTKIYLAVQPSSTEQQKQQQQHQVQPKAEPVQSQPPPLAPVQQNVIQHPKQHQQTQQQIAVKLQSQPQPTTVVKHAVSATVQQVCNMTPKPKVIVQPANQVLLF